MSTLWLFAITRFTYIYNSFERFEIKRLFFSGKFIKNKGKVPLN